MSAKKTSRETKKTFERTAGPMPVLRPAGPPPTRGS